MNKRLVHIDEELLEISVFVFVVTELFNSDEWQKVNANMLTLYSDISLSSKKLLRIVV